MKIPVDPIDREAFYIDLIQKCLVSRETRKSDYASLRSWYLFGNDPNEPPAMYNKIYPHIDQLCSFLYSAETTRFSIDLGAEVHEGEYSKIPSLTRALNDEWLNSNADQVFSSAVSWALTYNSSFIKLVVNRGIHPYMVEPSCIGVLREDVPSMDRQEAVVQTYYITRSELYSRLYSHPKREQIVSRVGSAPHERTETPNGIDRIIMSQVSPTMYGNVNIDLSGMNRYKAEVSEPTVEMRELWVWDDEREDYQVVTIADPDVIIYDRPGEQLFLKGELPFVQICPSPLYDYFWGQSEIQRLIYLQQMRNKRMSEIMDLLSKQVNPPTALIGFTGMLDEKNFALNRAGGLLATDMPSAKVEKLAPNIPQDMFKEIAEIDAMFEEASGIVSVLQGRGESGVRSSGHASQLARLGSSRAKRRALIIEDSLEKLATMYLKLMQRYDPTHFTDTNKRKFIAEQFTRDYVVKVDAHSNSPIFMEDLRNLAFQLFKAQAIDKESLLDLLEPPMKQHLKEKLRRAEEKQAKMQEQQQAQEAKAPKESKQEQKAK
ncbi:MAG: hypothetical protein EBR82_12055 [Caulobacteraceae bacterium]|nr:hypothetical protein [Caulobacteraceae bacterium]